MNYFIWKQSAKIIKVGSYKCMFECKTLRVKNLFKNVLGGSEIVSDSLFRFSEKSLPMFWHFSSISLHANQILIWTHIQFCFSDEVLNVFLLIFYSVQKMQNIKNYIINAIFRNFG